MSHLSRLYGIPAQSSHSRLTAWLSRLKSGPWCNIHAADEEIPKFSPESLQVTAYKGLTRLVATFGHGVTCS
ncbi:hypothetical protein EMIT0P176_10004 [Pseudomonas sp. IT-P176]